MTLIAFLYAFILAQAAGAGDALEKATPLQNWQLLVGMLLPGLLAVIIQTGWSRRTQSLVSMGVAMLASLVAAILSDDRIIVPEMIVRGLELFVIAITSYYGIWKPTGAAPTIEAATSR